MGWFRRPATVSADVEPEPPGEARPGTGGKGRPTPKRREAEKRRRAAVAAPATRREAYRRRRAEIKDERRTTRRALMTGDAKNLPPRDAGPVRALVRDIVDSRRNLAGFVLLFVFVAFVLSGVRNRSAQNIVFLVYVLVIAALLTDLWMLVRRVKREVRTRFGEKETAGVTSYAIMRALQFRRLRMPPPRVRRGQQI